MLTEQQCDDAIGYNVGRNYRSAAVKQIQQLVGTPQSGVWGFDDVQAVAAWQDGHRLVVDGMVGPDTFRSMQKEMAAASTYHPVMHPLPTITSMWGYDHCPDTYRKSCPAWHEATSEPTFVNGLLRLVSGGKDERDRFSRSPDSWISLDEFSIGIAHWWAGTAPRLLAKIARELPGIAAHAWGTTAASMRDTTWLSGQVRAKRGKRPHQTRYDWLLSGWWEIGQHPDVVALCAKQWVQDYTPAGLALMRKYGWSLASTLAGLVRVTNSRGAGGVKSLVNKAVMLAETKQETSVMKVLFGNKVYGHPERWDVITSLPHFEGEAPDVVSLENFRVRRALVVRVDGTVPKWAVTGL